MIQESKLRIVIDSRNAERNARNVANELQNIERNGDYASRSMDSMSVGIRQLVGQMGGLVTVGAAISKMDAYTGLQNRLKLVTDSQAELNTAMNDTFAIAQKTASSWDSVAMVYQRFADNADRLGISMKQTAALTETVSKAISVSGGSAASAEAALMQFGQALASGVLRGEEFNSIAEQAPGLLKAIAFGLNTNVGSLRAMAADGKITGDVLVDALGKAKPYIDDLFNKTDFTISQSFTKLSNEVTKFVGEAGKGSGAASALSDSIGFLAKNLSTIADIAIVGGVAMLTKTILAQTVAIQGSITASVARRAADIAVLQSQVQLAVVEAQRARNKVGELAAEQNLIVAKLRTNLATKERIALETRATQVAIQLAVAERNMTAATAQRTIAQNTLNASMSAGSRILGLVGGWTGVLTIGVAALAAGYMYLKNRTAEANAKLEEQGKIADQTDEELKKLSGNDKISSVEKLTETFESQNAALAKSKESVDAVLFAIRAASVENEKARKVTEDARKGVISYDEAIKRLNQMNIPTDLYDMLKKQVIQYDENSEKAGKSQYALKILGFEFVLTGNKAQNSAVQIAKDTDALDKNETAAQKAAKAQKAYADSLYDRDFDANFSKILLNAGETEGRTKALLEAANYAREKGVKFTKEMANEALRVYELENSVQGILDKRNEAEKERTKELEKQQKVLQVNAKVQALASKYNITAKETANNIPKGLISAMIMQESRGDTYRNGKLLTSPAGAQGVGQFMPGTAKQYGVDVRSEESSINGMIKMMSALIKQFGGDIDKAIMAYNAGPGNVQNGKAYGFKETKNYLSNVKGYMAGSTGFKQGDISSKEFDRILEESTRVAIEQAKARTQLEVEVSSEVEKIRANLQEKLDEIDAANFSPEKAQELKDEYQARADNDIAIAQYALKTKLDDYGAFKKTESQLLEDSFNERKFYAARDLELSKEQRIKAVQLLDEQLKQEQALLMLARETRLFQMREQFMTETAAMEERYRIEHMRLIETNDLEERNFQQQMLRLQKQEEVRNRLNNATQNWGQAQADMNGTGEQFQIEQTRFSRYDQSQELFDSQMAQTDQAAQDPNANTEAIAAQREAIWQAHHDRMTAIESDYQASSYSLQLGYGQQVTGALSGMFGAMLGESSSAYRALYGAQQAFALAQAGMNVWKSASDAYANEPGTVWQKMGAAALATIESGTFVTMIQAATPKGFAEGGFTGYGGKYEPAGIVHKWEGVLTKEEMMAIGGPQGFEGLRKSIKNGSYANGGIGGINNTARDTHRVGMGTVNAINSGGSGGKNVVQPKVTIINQTTKEVNATSEWDGDELKVYLQEMRKQNEAMMDAKIEKRFRMAGRQGWK